MQKATVDLRRLRYFVAVCEHGGFSRASSFVGTAQSALTRQIKLLENEIGLALIKRTGRGAEPTEAGRRLLAKSRQYLDGLDDLVRELRERSSTLSGHLVLGICPTIVPFFLDDLTGYVRNNHPNLTLSVIQAYSSDIDSLMSRNKLDLSLTYHGNRAKSAGSIDLFSERLVLVTGASPQNEKAALTLAQVTAKKLILISGIHELRRIIDAACRRRGITLKPDLELDSFDAISAMLIKGCTQYASILPYDSLRRQVGNRQLSFFEIDDSAMQRTIALVVAKNKNVHTSALLVDYIRRKSSDIKAELHSQL